MHPSRPSFLVVVSTLAIAAALPAPGAPPFSEARPAAGRAVSALAVPAGTPCAGLSNTTGNPDTSAPAGASGIFVQRFSPATTPFIPTAVCVATFSGIATAQPYDVVVFSDAGGVPGALLAAVPAVPAAPGSFPGTWVQTPVAGVPPVLGPIWAGVRIAAGTQMNMDFETTAVVAPQAISTDGGTTWEPAGGLTTASIVLAGSAEVTVPTLPVAGLAALLFALAAGGFLVLRRG